MTEDERGMQQHIGSDKNFWRWIVACVVLYLVFNLGMWLGEKRQRKLIREAIDRGIPAKLRNKQTGTEKEYACVPVEEWRK